MICTGTIARLTREAACNWSSRIATRHAGRAAVGVLIGAASGSITAAGLIFRLAGRSGAGTARFVSISTGTQGAESGDPPPGGPLDARPPASGTNLRHTLEPPKQKATCLYHPPQLEIR